MRGGKIRFVLLDRIGHARIDDTVTDEEMTAAIEELNLRMRTDMNFSAKKCFL